MTRDLDGSHEPVGADSASVGGARGTAHPGRASVLERVDALPVWLLVGGLVALSAVVRFILTRGYPSPWTWTDELLYAELAKSFGMTGHFAIRHIPGREGFGFVYPVLLSPAYALTSNVPAAYAVMKAINCVVMSLAAVPTYLIARRFVGRWLALTAALLVVAHPALTYTAGIMTENAFLPIFAFWCWAMLRMLEAPTVMRQLGAIALLLLAYFTRPQALMLLPALISALVLVTILDAIVDRDRSFGRALVRAARPYLVTWLIFAAGACGFLVLELVVRGKTWGEALFGPYSSLSAEHYSVTRVSHWLVYHIGELAFSLAVIPFAALLLVIFAGLDPREPNRKLQVVRRGRALERDLGSHRSRGVRLDAVCASDRGAQHDVPRSAVSRCPGRVCRGWASLAQADGGGGGGDARRRLHRGDAVWLLHRGLGGERRLLAAAAAERARPSHRRGAATPDADHRGRRCRCGALLADAAAVRDGLACGGVSGVRGCERACAPTD